MKYNTFSYTLLLSTLLLLFTGCEKVETGTPFNNIVNDRIRVDSNLSFSIENVNDYRCPVDVVCIWAGDVDIRIKFYKTFSSVDTIMNLFNPERNPISISGYTFKVNEVNPVPVSGKETPQEDFIINMTITKD